MSLGLGIGLVSLYNIIFDVALGCWQLVVGIDSRTLTNGSCVNVIDAYTDTPDPGYEIIDKFTIL